VGLRGLRFATFSALTGAHRASVPIPHSTLAARRRRAINHTSATTGGMPVIKLDDCSLEYFTCGSKTAEDGSPAPVITWVHGAGGNAFTFWANTPGFVTSSVPFHAPGLPESSAPLSKKAYYCIMISMRGWGGSRIHAEDPVQDADL